MNDDFERSTPASLTGTAWEASVPASPNLKAWEVSKPALAALSIRTTAFVSPAMIDVYCSGCRELVGHVGLPPREGAGITVMKFTCPCGASTKWESA